MQHFSKTAGYAIHALSFIGATAPEPCLVRDIAECLGLPKPYLARILNRLVHGGLVTAKRGYRGGLTLAKPPEQITLLEIVEAVEDSPPVSPCIFGLDKCCLHGKCPAHAPWQAMARQIRALLDQTPLSAVMQVTPPRSLSPPIRQLAMECC